MQRSIPLAATLVCLLAFAPGTALAFDEDQELTLIGAAAPDECFIEIGVSENILPNGTCENVEATAKTNQAYVWSLARTGSKLWFGTGANVNCLVGSIFLGASSANEVSGSYVCEYGSSSFISTMSSLGITLSAGLGDWRPPKIYVVDTTSTSSPTEISSGFTGTSRFLINRTVGLRAAGAVGSVVYLAGPALIGGINVFALNSSTQEVIAATNLQSFSNIRNFRVHDGSIYAGVANSTGGGGSLLKFSGDTVNPLEFETVLVSDRGEVAEFDFLGDQLYFGTWPNLVSTPRVEAAVFRIALEDLDESGSAPIQVWTASDYEPDPLIAMTYGVGALAAFDNQIYWGTMHVPYTSFRAKVATYGAPDTTQEAAQDFLGTLRASSVYRTSIPNDGQFDQPQLLYGNPLLPVCNRDSDGDLSASPPILPTCSWTVQPNEFGLPRFGLAGFGNPFNNYIWSMAELDEELYVGTMDWSYLIVPNLPGSPDVRIFQASSLVNQFLGQIDDALEALRTELDSGEPDFPALVIALSNLQEILDNTVDILPDGSDLELSVQSASENLTAAIEDIESLNEDDPEAVAAIIGELNLLLNSIDLINAQLEVVLNSIAGQFPELRFGADLFRFTKDEEIAAEDLSVDGLGNQMNYGIRTMVANSDSLYLGTANPMNLRADNLGGWELYRLNVPEVAEEVQPAPAPPIRVVLLPPLLQVNPILLSGYPGDLISVPGENFPGADVTLASIPLQSLTSQSNLFNFVIPEVQAGMHKLRFYQSSTGRTFEFDFEIKQRPIVSTSKLNAGSFNGYVSIYAKGHKGSTLSWRIAGKWFKTIITKDFQVFQRRTSLSGKRVQVELFVNGVKPAALSMSVLTK